MYEKDVLLRTVRANNRLLLSRADFDRLKKYTATEVKLKKAESAGVPEEELAGLINETYIEYDAFTASWNNPGELDFEFHSSDAAARNMEWIVIFYNCDYSYIVSREGNGWLVRFHRSFSTSKSGYDESLNIGYYFNEKTNRYHLVQWEKGCKFVCTESVNL